MKINNLPEPEIKLIEAAVAMCEQGINDYGGLSPMLIMVEDKTGELHTLDLTGVEKNQTGAIINGARTLAAVLFIAEAWTRTMEAAPESALAKAIKEDVKTAIIPAPHDCPDRKECVMVQFFHHKRHIMMTAEIKRTPDAKATLGEWRSIDNADADSKLYQASFSPPGARLA